MEKYEEFLQTLAEKLGTTVEYLWEVMVRQAAISATTNLLLVCVCWAVLIWSFKLLKRKTTGENPAWDDEPSVFAWCTWAFILLVVFLSSTVAVGDIVTGYLNPEYWALMKLKQ